VVAEEAHSPAAEAVSAAAEREGAGEAMSWFKSSLSIDKERIVSAIAAAELRTSGEIRVLVAEGRAQDPVAAAKRHFERLGMTKTAARNGVLIFVAPGSRTFAVIGDTGVHEKCGDAFWQELAAAMSEEFKRGEFTAGLVQGIGRAGVLLAEHFPRRSDDKNELPDEIEGTE
jgi:uncharacterized membrane protein